MIGYAMITFYNLLHEIVFFEHLLTSENGRVPLFLKSNSPESEEYSARGFESPDGTN